MALSDRFRTPIRVGIWLVAFLAACATFVTVRDQSLLVSVLAIFAVVGAALELHEVVRRELAGGGLRLMARVVLFLLLPVAGAALIVCWALGIGDGWGFFGVALLYLGFGLIVESLRNQAGFPERWGPVLLGACAALLVLGLVGMTLSGRGWAVVVAATGLLLSPVGLSLVSGAASRVVASSGRVFRSQLALAGLGSFAGGLVLMAALGVNVAFVLVFGAAILVLLLAIAGRSNADIVLVIATAAVVWTLADRSIPKTDAVTASNDETVIVALGDSYISGEGADEFYEGTNTKGGNECRQAPTSYPALLMLEDHPRVPEDLVFLACSGARVPRVREQLGEFRDMRQDLDFEVEFVLLSVGGNDALFGSIARTCLLPGDCSALGPAWTDHLDAVGDRLAGLYDDVGETFGDTPVLVVPYPIPLRETGCSYSGFSDDEHRFLHEFTIELNGVIERTAGDAGFHVVDTMPDALVGRRLCEGPAGEVGVNFLAANSVLGTLEQAIYPLNWFHNSLHPNPQGHELMRSSLLQWLDDHPDLDTVDVASPPATTADEASGDQRCRGRVGADLEACTTRWAIEETGFFLLTRGSLAALVALGAWLLTLSLIHVWRTIF